MNTKTKTKRVTVTYWSLKNTTTRHAFYEIYLADDGSVITAWGAIGTTGQTKFEKFPNRVDAETVALRQFYTKAAKDYAVVDNRIPMVLDEDTVTSLFRAQNINQLRRLVNEVKGRDGFAAAGEAAAQHYDDFIERAQSLLDRVAGGHSTEGLLESLSALKESWEELDARHGTASVTLTMAEAMISQQLNRS